MKKPKTPIVAGMLGIFLGFTGAHDFYTGRYKRGVAHLLVFGLGLTLLIAAAVIDTTTLGTFRREQYGELAVMQVVYILAFFVLGCTVIWAQIDAYQILISGKISVPEHSNHAASATAPSPEELARKAKKRKTLRIALGVTAGVVVLAAIGGVVAYVLLHIDYGESYRVARDLRGKLSDVYKNNSCQDVVDTVNNNGITNATYDTYIENCLAFASDKNEYITVLGESSAIRKNSELSAKFETFRSAYQSALPQLKGLDERLKLYRAWHEYILLLTDLTAYSSREEFQAAADVLINTGDKTLSSYATEWLKLALAYRDANAAYWGDVEAGAAELDALQTARDEYSDFLMNEAPNLTTFVDLGLDGMQQMFTSFTDLYNAVAKGYEEHYDYDSKDCEELLYGKVYCP